MSKINFNRNIFLEKEELVRFQKFVGVENIATQVLIDNSIKWGIVRTSFDENYVDFKIEAGSNSGTIKIANLSKAVTASKNLIKQEAIDNIEVPDNGNWYWVKISHQFSPIEQGTCSINTSGQVTGNNTLFTEILRGQSTEVPVKIKFSKDGVVNDGIYEVVDLIDNTHITLIGGAFTTETDLQYFVVGSIPIGETVTAQHEQGIYQYDSCLIELIAQELEDTPPATNYVEDEQFYLARVSRSGSSVTIQDKREDQFLTFNVEGMNDKLVKDQNLADLTDVAVARENLGVLSEEETLALFSETNWLPMTKGVAASATNYDIKIKRIGKLCIVTGKFGGANTSANAIIASILFANLLPVGSTLKQDSIIYFSAAANIDDRRLLGYIPAYVEGDTSIQLKMFATIGDTPDSTYLINFSFFLS